MGWPSFVGALSAIAPGRFSVSLNAALSIEPPEIAMPVVFLVRDVLETCPTYDHAVRRLAETPIASDCLLLVTGVDAGEMCVIERTPTNSATRPPDAGAVCATNDYRRIDADTGVAAGELLATSCRRYERIGELLSERPETLERCIDLLSDPAVRMSITVQQMAFHPRSGRHVVVHPRGPVGSA